VENDEMAAHFGGLVNGHSGTIEVGTVGNRSGGLGEAGPVTAGDPATRAAQTEERGSEYR
jgi:hypothetical protein